MSKMTFKQMAIAVVLSTLSVLAAVNVAYMIDVGRADAISLKAREELIAIKSHRADINYQSWKSLFDQFNTIRNIVPASPQVHEDLAYIYAIRSSVKTSVPSSAESASIVQSNLEKAEAQYKTSIRLRPMASAAWANLALASFLLKRDNTVIASQIDRALDLGEKDSVTLIPLFFIMTRGGNKLFIPQQSRLIEAFRGLRTIARQDVIKAML